MPAKFSLMIIDENREVRDCLSEIFCNSDFEINLAESPVAALNALPQDHGVAWPDAIILGQQIQSPSADAFLSQLQSRRPEAKDQVSLILFPSFKVSVPSRYEASARQVHVCRLSTIANLLAMVRGLAMKRDFKSREISPA
jgi:CheY-like chemotaxis protein